MEISDVTHDAGLGTLGASQTYECVQWNLQPDGSKPSDAPFREVSPLMVFAVTSSS